MPKTESKSRYKYQMSRQCRRSASKQKAVLAWIKSDTRYSQNGRKPTVEEFIAEALRRGSPLLKARVLEPDKNEAAKIYYREEAQYYLRHVNVVRIDVKLKTVSQPVRAWIPVKFEPSGRIKEKSYLSAKRVANDPSSKEKVLDRALHDLLAWKARYERIAGFMGMYGAVVEAIHKLEEELCRK